ncbi:MAG TPA: HEAT repeat domain-containing protein [Geomonas sp.]
MSEQVRKSGESPPPGHPSSEEISSATDVMSAMVRTAKGLRIYLPNNPVLIRFAEELNGKITAHMARYGDFKLDVETFALWYKGTEVYQNQDTKESIAFRMHSDGIRVLMFSQGLADRELTVFLEIVGFERPSQRDDDIVTRLWERSLPHITCLLEDDFVEINSLEEDDSARASQQGALSEILGVLASSSLPAPRMVPTHLLMLTGEEANWLRKAKQADAQRSPLDDVINILSAILAGVKDPETFRDFADITVNLTVNMFLAGEIGHVLRLVRFMAQLLTLGSIQPDQREQIAGSLAGILSEKTLQVLQEAIDGGETVSHEELKELLQIFGLPSLAAICELLGRVEKLKTRKVVIEVLIELGKDNPEVFAPFLSDPRWFLVRNVVMVLSLLGTPVALRMIVGLISHKEPRIRKEVLGFLERSADPKARAYIVKFLRDDSSALRIRALQILARERLPFALKPILALTTADDFKTREIAERKAVYEALGELGSEQMIPLFREMLLKKSWFKRANQKDSAICAVAGLLKVRSPAALELLEEARNHGNVEIRGIVAQAIEAVAAGTGKTAA